MAWIKTGNIKGPQGPQGPAGADGADGAPGPPGPQGAAGTGITFKGTVPTVGDLPPSGNINGDAYLVETDDSLHIWDGTQWVDGGAIQGPPGPPGVDGADGSPGVRGSLWHSVTGDPSGIITVGNITGDQALDTASGDVYQWT